jgi:putative transposase
MIKGFKIRLFPTKSQEELMWKHIHASRFIYNYMLALQNERYANGEKHLSAFDMHKLLSPLKKQEEFAWLKDVASTMLRRSCADLADAFTAFFKKISRHPKFKSRKRSKTNYPTREDRLYFEDGFAQIEKLGKVRYKTDFDLPQGHGHKFSNPRVSYKNGKWMLSFCIECESQAPELNDFSMGIDLGVKDLATVAYGDDSVVFHNINKSHTVRTIKRNIRLLQRRISRKYEKNKQGNKFVKTRNIERLEERLRRMYARLANIRNNYIHQTTHALVSLLPKKVVMEDLNVTGMMKNRHLSKAVAEQCFYEFIRQMQYKCAWNGIEFVQANRFYPSSKTCSCCGSIKKDLKLSDRTYRCSECGSVIDRDLNAAINLTRYEG